MSDINKGNEIKKINNKTQRNMKNNKSKIPRTNNRLKMTGSSNINNGLAAQQTNEVSLQRLRRSHKIGVQFAPQKSSENLQITNEKNQLDNSNLSFMARRASKASHVIYEPKSVSDIGEQFTPQRKAGSRLAPSLTARKRAGANPSTIELSRQLRANNSSYLFSQNKKGVAEVITTLLLTAIAVGAVLFAWSAIQPVLNKANIAESPEYNCLQLQFETNPVLEITKACYNSQTAQHEITVKRSAMQSTPVFEMLFTFHSTVPESSWRCSDTCSAETGGCQVPDKGQAKTYFFTNDNPENLKSVKIYLGECELDMKTIVNC